jgi:MoxR-like ATPase
VQCTPDLLPSDVTGVAIYNPRTLGFEFRPGPVFANVLLADEVNRATPRTQSAFLEAMEERQVTVDGAAHPLPDPFVVLATQNPIELAGTFPLPEAQLDRFLVRLSLGPPDDATERRVLVAQRDGHPLDRLEAVADLPQLRAAQAAVREVHVHDSVVDYVQRLVAATRGHAQVACGASTRGALALLHVAQALALLGGAGYVTPDHVQRLAVAALAHRVLVKARARVQGLDGRKVVEEVVHKVPVPIEYAPPAATA